LSIIISRIYAIKQWLCIIVVSNGSSTSSRCYHLWDWRRGEVVLNKWFTGIDGTTSAT
jgi:hypothetical protein